MFQKFPEQWRRDLEQVLRKLDQRGIAKKIQASLFQILSINIQIQNARMIMNSKIDKNVDILGNIRDLCNRIVR